MNLFFETTYQNDLVVYIGFGGFGSGSDSVVSYHNFRDRIHTYSEYDTKFSNILQEWYKKGYYEGFSSETLVGELTTVLYKLKFVGKSAGCSKELIKEIQTYFGVYSPTESYRIVESKKFNDKSL